MVSFDADSDTDPDPEWQPPWDHPCRIGFRLCSSLLTPTKEVTDGGPSSPILQTASARRHSLHWLVSI
jgi:hypothetical protein